MKSNYTWNQTITSTCLQQIQQYFYLLFIASKNSPNKVHLKKFYSSMKLNSFQCM